MLNPFLHVDLSKIREKLQEARTIEERRLIIEELRDRRTHLWELYRTVLGIVLLLLSGQGLASIYTVYSHVVHCGVTPLVLAVVQGFTAPLVISVAVLYYLDSKIKQIDSILLDPETMLGKWLIIAILITSLVFTIIGTIFGLAALGIIRL